MRLSLQSRSTSGVTLIELSVTIAVILILAGIVAIGVKPYYAYRDGRTAGEMLRAVKAAQLMYLSDNPSARVEDLTQANLLPYMPNGLVNGQVNPLAWPTLPSINGQQETPTINFNVFPPVSTYDPSGSPTDGLWDVGQY
jgi:prepilin-type N-terminal cleavage/methylation domain-containing protein